MTAVPARRVRARGPGRVNLIGEHTDYNEGLCLPFAVERGVTVTAEPGVPGVVEALAMDLGEEDRFDAGDPQAAPGWRAFVRGVVAELRAAGIEVDGARLRIESDLPRGAGLSSSAALESALCLALIAFAGRPEPERRELARLCSRVEHRWAGAETGLLDQMASLLAREGHAMLLDCRDLSVEHVALDLGGWTLCVADSGARHEHAESGYNERRRECAAACSELGIESLRDAGEAEARRLPEPLRSRALHVLAENERVRLAVEALRSGDLAGLAALLDASHASLRDLFDVSIPAVEDTIARMKHAGAAGARIMGGGFGGAVLAL
ncbi:MAG: galactokinase family protein, partial [Thermoleophilaceae bacterium]